MIGTIEDLERDIEQFQKNVASSGEMVQLLKEMVASIRQQNIDFEAGTNKLISKLNSLPITIEGSNSEMQENIKCDVASKLDKALKELSIEQAKYIQGLEITKQQIQNYIEQSKLQELAFSERVNILITKIDGVPDRISSNNERLLEQIKGDFTEVFAEKKAELHEEQGKYISSLQKTNEVIQNYIEQSKLQEQAFSEKVNTITSKIDGVPDRISTNNERLLEQIKSDFAEVFIEKKAELHEEQGKYISSLQKTNEVIQNYIERSKEQEKSFVDKASEMIDKMDTTPEVIASMNEKMLECLKKEVDDVLEQRNVDFVAKQKKYLDSLNEMDVAIKECEGNLSAKYNEFVDTLDKMNLSNLYEQNVQLKNEMNKRTTILIVITGISLLLGVIGLIL